MNEWQNRGERMNIKTVVTLYPDKIVAEYFGQDGKDTHVIEGKDVASLKAVYERGGQFLFDAYMSEPHGELVFRVGGEADGNKGE